jgi:hypothetical protein
MHCTRLMSRQPSTSDGARLRWASGLRAMRVSTGPRTEPIARAGTRECLARAASNQSCAWRNLDG